jgi:hypothetical protein
MTPHNTTQYLTHNYSQGRNEKVMAIPVEFYSFPIQHNPQINIHEEEDENEVVDYVNLADDYCIPGGSMRGEKSYLI